MPEKQAFDVSIHIFCGLLHHKMHTLFLALSQKTEIDLYRMCNLKWKPSDTMCILHKNRKK